MDIRTVDANAVSYNGWKISNCRHPQNMTELNRVLGFLFQLKPNLEAVIADARLGTRSPHGYAVFFKTSTSIRRVVAKFQSMVDVTPVIVTPERAKVIGTRTPQPRFQCLGEGDDPIIKLCTRNPRSLPLFIVHPGTERISICPNFFRVKQYSLPRKSCPTLGADGRFRPGDGSLMSNAFAYAVHALVLLYGREFHVTTPADTVDSIYDMQYAVDLNARQSLLNQESYAFYAGGRVPKVFPFFLWEGNVDG
ncbi:MAG: hypothetical protein Q9208_000178 [Pyrenodesmia sp. 3 TL-2023]